MKKSYNKSHNKIKNNTLNNNIRKTEDIISDNDSDIIIKFNELINDTISAIEKKSNDLYYILFDKYIFSCNSKKDKINNVSNNKSKVNLNLHFLFETILYFCGYSQKGLFNNNNSNNDKNETKTNLDTSYTPSEYINNFSYKHNFKDVFIDNIINKGLVPSINVSDKKIEVFYKNIISLIFKNYDLYSEISIYKQLIFSLIKLSKSKYRRIRFISCIILKEAINQLYIDLNFYYKKASILPECRSCNKSQISTIVRKNENNDNNLIYKRIELVEEIIYSINEKWLFQRMNDISSEIRVYMLNILDNLHKSDMLDITNLLNFAQNTSILDKDDIEINNNTADDFKGFKQILREEVKSIKTKTLTLLYNMINKLISNFNKIKNDFDLMKNNINVICKLFNSITEELIDIAKGPDMNHSKLVLKILEKLSSIYVNKTVCNKNNSYLIINDIFSSIKLESIFELLYHKDNNINALSANIYFNSVIYNTEYFGNNIIKNIISNVYKLEDDSNDDISEVKNNFYVNKSKTNLDNIQENFVYIIVDNKTLESLIFKSDLHNLYIITSLIYSFNYITDNNTDIITYYFNVFYDKISKNLFKNKTSISSCFYILENISDNITNCNWDFNKLISNLKHLDINNNDNNINLLFDLYNNISQIKVFEIVCSILKNSLVKFCNEYITDKINLNSETYKNANSITLVKSHEDYLNILIVKFLNISKVLIQANSSQLSSCILENINLLISSMTEALEEIINIDNKEIKVGLQVYCFKQCCSSINSFLSLSALEIQPDFNVLLLNIKENNNKNLSLFNRIKKHNKMINEIENTSDFNNIKLINTKLSLEAKFQHNLFNYLKLLQKYQDKYYIILNNDSSLNNNNISVNKLIEDYFIQNKKIHNKINELIVTKYNSENKVNNLIYIELVNENTTNKKTNNKKNKLKELTNKCYINFVDIIKTINYIKLLSIIKDLISFDCSFSTDIVCKFILDIKTNKTIINFFNFLFNLLNDICEAGNELYKSVKIVSSDCSQYNNVLDKYINNKINHFTSNSQQHNLYDLNSNNLININLFQIKELHDTLDILNNLYNLTSGLIKNIDFIYIKFFISILNNNLKDQGDLKQNQSLNKSLFESSYLYTNMFILNNNESNIDYLNINNYSEEYIKIREFIIEKSRKTIDSINNMFDFENKSIYNNFIFNLKYTHITSLVDIFEYNSIVQLNDLVLANYSFVDNYVELIITEIINIFLPYISHVFKENDKLTKKLIASKSININDENNCSLSLFENQNELYSNNIIKITEAFSKLVLICCDSIKLEKITSIFFELFASFDIFYLYTTSIEFFITKLIIKDIENFKYDNQNQDCSIVMYNILKCTRNIITKESIVCYYLNKDNLNNIENNNKDNLISYKKEARGEALSRLIDCYEISINQLLKQYPNIINIINSNIDKDNLYKNEDFLKLNDNEKSLVNLYRKDKLFLHNFIINLVNQAFKYNTNKFIKNWYMPLFLIKEFKYIFFKNKIDYKFILRFLINLINTIDPKDYNSKCTSLKEIKKYLLEMSNLTVIKEENTLDDNVDNNNNNNSIDKNDLNEDINSKEKQIDIEENNNKTDKKTNNKKYKDKIKISDIKKK